MGTDIRSLPGVYSGNQLRTRQIFANLDPAQRQYVVSGPRMQINGALTRDIGENPVSLIRAGTLMGKITSTGYYRNSVIGVTNGAISSGTATSVTVAAAVATEIARLITVAGGNVNLAIVGPPTAAGTVASTAVTATASSGTTVTISSVSLPAIVDKSLIVPTDGSQVPVTVIEEQAGIDVNDVAGNNINQTLGRFLRGADLVASAILVGNAALTDLDASTEKYLKQLLNGATTPSAASPFRGLWTFNDDR